MRSNAVIYAPFLKNSGVVVNNLLHVSDLLPTLGKIAGVKFDARTKLDGVDQWGLINGIERPRRMEIANFDNVLGFGSYIYLNYKVVNGTTSQGSYDGWLANKTTTGNNNPSDYVKSVLNSEAGRAIKSLCNTKPLTAEKILKLRNQATVRCTSGVERNPCNPTKAPCLFDITSDPCEENNLATTRRIILNGMLTRYNDRVMSAVPSRRTASDPASDPINFDRTWNWWQKDS